ncbi:hypothetical protein GCM10009839_36400 [Catenulispora yoronensis]|uniref:Uncharacterized protein n=1 Tax=Catenulispora yoronensis TaxID=450799 RepID=A0ABN2UGY8_9ACTN
MLAVFEFAVFEFVVPALDPVDVPVSAAIAGAAATAPAAIADAMRAETASGRFLLIGKTPSVDSSRPQADR